MGRRYTLFRSPLLLPSGSTDWIFRSEAASEEKGPFVSVTQPLPDRVQPSGS